MEKTDRSLGDYLELQLSWEDLNLLNRGKPVETRWCSEGKVYVYNMDSSSRGNHKKMERSLRKMEGAVWNRGTMDIRIYVPSGVLNNGFYSAANFSREAGNLGIKPHSGDLSSMNIRLIFPKNSVGND